MSSGVELHRLCCCHRAREGGGHLSPRRGGYPWAGRERERERDLMLLVRSQAAGNEPTCAGRPTALQCTCTHARQPTTPPSGSGVRLVGVMRRETLQAGWTQYFAVEADSVRGALHRKTRSSTRAHTDTHCHPVMRRSAEGR
jgi:hypothetical protein